MSVISRNSIYRISIAEVRAMIGLARRRGSRATEQALEQELQRRLEIEKEVAA